MVFPSPPYIFFIIIGVMPSKTGKKQLQFQSLVRSELCNYYYYYSSILTQVFTYMQWVMMMMMMMIVMIAKDGTHVLFVL